MKYFDTNDFPYLNNDIYKKKLKKLKKLNHNKSKKLNNNKYNIYNNFITSIIDIVKFCKNIKTLSKNNFLYIGVFLIIISILLIPIIFYIK